VSDRGLQDLVLRALADAPFRASREWQDQALADPGRLERFARFLARHYYYERIVHFFKYSGALAPVTGRRPEAVLRSASFDALLATAVLGSRETARAVASVVVRDVQAATPSQPIPYLSDLLSYERAMMIAEAGPRVWRETAVLPRLLEPWTEVPQAPSRPVKLLVARSPHGRVTVARADAAVASVVELADGRKTLADLARQAGLRAADLEAALAGLADLGAVRFTTGS